MTGTRHIKHDIVGEYGIDPRKIAVIPIRSALPPTPRQPRRRSCPPAVQPARALPALPGDDVPAQEPPAAVRGAGDPARPARPDPAAGLHRPPYESHSPVLRSARPTRADRPGADARLGPGRGDWWRCSASAWALVFPSLFEGIGMPVIEALQYGLPVISSNAACLPEVAGDAALYFDPTRVDSIVEAILTADRQPELLERADRPRRPYWPASAGRRPPGPTSPATGRRPGAPLTRRAAGALRGGDGLVTVELAPEARHERRTTADRRDQRPGRPGSGRRRRDRRLKGSWPISPQQAPTSASCCSPPSDSRPALRRWPATPTRSCRWPYPPKAHPGPADDAALGALARPRPGRSAFGVDGCTGGWWQARRLTAPRPDPRRPTPSCGRGASVVHFAYPIRFGTSLPFSYEPWDLQHRHHPELFDAGRVALARPHVSRRAASRPRWS